ncbi:hypothetical protein [Streptomyces sp. NPDC056682]|uniref:hypothetical protein n=1 Tax=Streptomyces sp. NPDC056682 TaxID=3345909 RepID=UPI0036A432F9
MPILPKQQWREACAVASDASNALQGVLLDLGAPPHLALKVCGMPTTGGLPVVSIPDLIPASVIQALVAAARRGME